MSQNHTSIDDLVELQDNPSPFLSSGSPEGPRVSRDVESNPEKHEFDDNETLEIKEHEPDPEIEEHVEVRKETVEVPPDLKNMGVQAHQPQHFSGAQKVQLPISDDKVLQGQKAPINTSLRWLAEFCIYLLRRAHIQLKIAHGKAQRIFKQ